MKKFNFFVLSMLSLFIGGSSVFAATQYCGKTLSGGSNSIQLTCQKEGGVPVMRIVGENLNGLGGTFFNPGAVDIRNRITSKTSTEIVITFQEENPQLYTPLYVLMPGEVNFGNIDEIDWNATCAAPTEPSINVSKDKLSFISSVLKPQTFTVTGKNLSDAISISSSSANFTVSPASIEPEAEFPVTVTVTCSATEDETAELEISSEGAQSQTISLSYTNYVTQPIVFTESCKIEGAGVFLYFNGYGTTYARDLSKYTVTVTSTNQAISSITVQNPAAAYLYCAMNAAPVGDDITTVTLTYENGDSGSASFKGSTYIVTCELTTPPVINTLAESEIGADYAKLSVSATDEEGADVTMFIVSSVSFDEQVLESEEGILTIENLEPDTEYTVDVYAMDRCDNVSDPSSITFTTDVATEDPDTKANTSDTYKLFENNIKQVVVVTEENVYKLSGEELK